MSTNKSIMGPFVDSSNNGNGFYRPIHQSGEYDDNFSEGSDGFLAAVQCAVCSVQCALNQSVCQGRTDQGAWEGATIKEEIEKPKQK